MPPENDLGEDRIKDVVDGSFVFSDQHHVEPIEHILGENLLDSLLLDEDALGLQALQHRTFPDDAANSSGTTEDEDLGVQQLFDAVD